MAKVALVPLGEEEIRLLIYLLAPEGGWSADPVKGRAQAALSIGLAMALVDRTTYPDPIDDAWDRGPESTPKGELEAIDRRMLVLKNEREQLRQKRLALFERLARTAGKVECTACGRFFDPDPGTGLPADDDRGLHDCVSLR